MSLTKKIPLWFKVPVMGFLNEVGKVPCAIAWQHARYSYAQLKELPNEKKERIFAKSHKVIYGYLKKKYGSFLTEQAKHYSQGTKNENFPIWILWWQGEQAAPELVKRCIRTIRNHANGHPVHVIHQGNYTQFLTLEPHIIEKMKNKTISLTHFSDIIRMNLLAEHGGFWLDSTIFCRRQIGGAEFDHPIFTLRNPNADRTNISRWEWTGFAIYGWQAGKLFCLMRDFFNRYWQEHSRLVDYFLIDYGIRLICDCCPDVQALINDIPANNPKLYFYQQQFNCEHTGTLADVDTDCTWLYKLTWKEQYRLETEDGKRTLFAAWYEETMP